MAEKFSPDKPELFTGLSELANVGKSDVDSAITDFETSPPIRKFKKILSAEDYANKEDA